MAKAKITLFVDTVSPFAYMAFYALRNFPIFEECEITCIPILLGGLMKLCGNTPPIQIKNKDKWVQTERLRWCRLFSIPMHEGTPPDFPIRTLEVQRALCALTMERPAALPDALSVLYNALWIEHAPLQNSDVTISLLGQVLGSEDVAKDLYAKGASAEAKELLTRNTMTAFEEGAFGLPWFVVTNSKGEKEGYWGFDHLGQVVDHLGLERPKSGGWRAML